MAVVVDDMAAITQATLAGTHSAKEAHGCFLLLRLTGF
jgi:hypothetical protein